MSSTLDGKNLVLRSSLLLVTPVCPPVSTLNLLAVERQIGVDSCLGVSPSCLCSLPAV